ncbi:TIGR00296 family protein [Candidatus Bathyarchaeota archaeon]|nr:TIGR00296 family protein [Candidatus Bathyarchaeota archaeon]
MSFTLSDEEGEFLVKLARRAVEQYLTSRKRIEAPVNVSDKFTKPCGVFVTINRLVGREKELRGCIGYPYPTNPLVEAVIDSAISSATQDPRFPPLSFDELDSVIFEVSVLTPPEIIRVEKPSQYPSKVKIGEDGLIIERGLYKGLLLPQVPVEWGWDSEEFLCQCCLKAGLPPDCWLLEGTKVYKFQAIIFEEEAPKGKVKRKLLQSPR